jgi:hypothetical protein
MFNPTAPAVVPAQPAILHASTSSSPEVVRFLTALTPAHAPDTAREQSATLRRIESPAWLGVERSGASTECLLFRKAATMQPASFDGWMTDAAAWFVRGESRPQLVAALGLTSLKRGNELWFASPHSASFSAEYRNGATALSVYSAVAQTLRLRQPDGRLEQIAVNPGNHEFSLNAERSR